MRKMVRLFFFVLMASLLLPTGSAKAQRGELIEGLFRTIAEAQIQREREKLAERMQREKEKLATESSSRDPYQVQLPSGFDRRQNGTNNPSLQNPSLGGLPPNGPGTFVDPNRRGNTGSINVRSREAAEFAGNLVQFNSGLSSLVHALRSQSSQQARLRTLLPEAYSVSAEGQALVRQCDGLSSLGAIVAPYRQLDARWRQLSFELRSAGPLGSTTDKMIRDCDRWCSAMAGQLDLQPQIDRRALHDVMIQAATYMQVLLDDIELVSMSSSQARRLSHDCRLLRQRLLGEADHVPDASYEEIVSRFSDFTRRWSEFSQRVYELDHPHLNRRLDRIGECGDHTYGLLWMTAPASSNQVPVIAHRLERSVESIQDQLTLRALATLRRDDQLRIMESNRALYDKARQLETASEKGASPREQQAILSEILRIWVPLRNTLHQIGSLNHVTLAEIDHSCEQLQLLLGVTGDVVTSIDIQSLLQACASLEGASEYLDADLQRYARYLQPDSYRKSLMRGSEDFHEHAKQLHALLSRPGAGLDSRSIKDLQREAERMLDGWETLSRELAHLDHHGLSSSRAARIKRSQQELVPFVAQVAAALLER